MTATAPKDALNALWRHAAQDPAALDAVTLTGAEPVLPSSFPVGTAAQVTIAASALAAAELWRLRGGRGQSVSVDLRHAAVEARSEHYLALDGQPVEDHRDPVTGVYRCADGRFLRVHANMPHHRAGIVKLLGCEQNRAAAERAIAGWKAEDLETAATAAGLVVSATRTFAEWDAHPQGVAVASLPPFSIERIGDAPAEPLPPGERPLAGVKVLDLTRVIAGPVCGRTLAGHGADVLLVTAPHLPAMRPLVIDNGRGKLSMHLDLREASARETLTGLLRQADIFVQGYRPGAIAQYGFSPQEAARIRPGVVCVSLCAYGHVGPWAGKRGFDSLVQNANGLNAAEAEAFGMDRPKPLPAQALDHGTGFLMAFAAMTALKRRAIEGGSWHVRCSLAQTGYWFRGLGRVDGLKVAMPTLDAVRDRLEESDSGFGRLTAVRHSAAMSETPPRWDRPSVPLGSHSAAWS
ncbi:MAG: CoA transferase [Alphaproteobacteria bacterium]|nr:CoA transferase [Alphaproteobacteria bacterium]